VGHRNRTNHVPLCLNRQLLLVFEMLLQEQDKP